MAIKTRRFQVRDVLWLTASVAVALGLSQRYGSVIEPGDSILTIVHKGRWSALVLLTTVIWGLALNILTDRTTRKESLSSAGKLAIVVFAGTSFAVLTMTWSLLLTSHLSIGARVIYWLYGIVYFPMVPACATLTAWLIPRSAAPAGARADWLDMFGVAMGVLWILVAVANPLLDAGVLSP